MPQQVQLQQTTADGMIVKMCGCDCGIHIVCRSLNGTKFIDIMVTGYNHQTTGVLPCGSLDTSTSIHQTGNLRIMGSDFPFIKIFFHKTISRFICQGANGTGFEHMPYAEQFFCIGMGCLLIFPRKVQVNIRFFIPFKSKECLEWNIVTILMHECTAFRAVHIRHVTSAGFFHGVRFHQIRIKVGIFAVRANIMGWQRVYLRNPCHVCRKGRTYGTTGTNQIAVSHRFPYQFLRNDIKHRIAVADDGVQFCFQTLLYQWRQRIAINGMRLIHANLPQLLIGTLNFRRECFIWNGLDFFNLVCDKIGVGDDNLSCLFLSQIIKFFQHFICCSEIQGRLVVRIGETFRCHDDFTVCRVIRVNEMHVTGCHNRLSIGFAQFHNLPVHVFDVFHRMDIFHSGRINHKFIVAQRLNFQIIIKMYQFLNALLWFAVQKSTIQFPRFAGTAQNQAFPHLHKFAFGDSRATEEIINMCHGNQFIEIPQTCIVLHQNDGMISAEFFIVHRTAGKNIDFIQGENLLFCQHIQEFNKYFRCCFRIVDGTMVSVQCYAQMFTNNIQFVFIQFWQQSPCQFQSIHNGMM